MAELQLNGVRLYYEEHGQGPLILCIHGAGSSALMWGAAVPELARLGRVIAYDRRGCSRSQRPVPYDKTSVAEHADDAAALLDALETTPAVLIGRSYGGEIAIDLTLRYPERVRGLALLEGAPLGLSAEGVAWVESVRRRVLAAAGDDLTTVGEIFIRVVLGDSGWEAFPTPVRQLFTDNGPAIVAEMDGGPLPVDRATLTTIDQPVLLVAAADSPEVFRHVSGLLGDLIPLGRGGCVLLGGLGLLLCLGRRYCRRGRRAAGTPGPGRLNASWEFMLHDGVPP